MNLGVEVVANIPIIQLKSEISGQILLVLLCITIVFIHHLRKHPSRIRIR